MPTNDHITLKQAAAISPGRPSTHSIWRWCRKGVKPRSGRKIFLRHVRVGGKIYTHSKWLFDFFREVAKADESHFRDGDGGTASADAHTAPNEPDITDNIRFSEHILDDAGI